VDERPLKLLERAPEEHRDVLIQLAKQAGDLAAAAKQDLQFDFGKDTIGFIVGCNQFLRLHFRGDRAGKVSLPKAAGVEGEPADEAVFKMFGWQTVPSMGNLSAAIEQSYVAAQT
jgi:hypothetical protein